MADWTYKFKWQYDYAKQQIANTSDFSDEWTKAIEKLKRLLGAEGFAVAEAGALDELRRLCVIAGGKKVGMADGLLAAVKVGGNNAPTIPENAKLRASALKFLAHTYLLNISGNRQIWVHSSPKFFEHWPSIHINSWASTTGEVKRLLGPGREQFSEDDKKHLKSAATRALAWIHRANIVLGHAPSSVTRGNPSWAREQVRKWFADPTVTETQLDGFIDTLSRGFKQITAVLNKGMLVLTDFIPVRTATSEEDRGYRDANAFAFGRSEEGMDVIYIQQNFFVKDAGSLLSGEAHWARIIIHELSHHVCGTDDVKTAGKSRYGMEGIGPHAGFPGTLAIKNADSWACFAVDSAGGMTDAQRTRALKIV